MPAAGLPWPAAEHLWRSDEILRLVRIAVTRLGITRSAIHGERLLAKHVGPSPTRRTCSRDRDGADHQWGVVGTTCGGLARAGLDRVNVSLDSVESAHFSAITRRDRLTDVLAGLAAASAAGLRPVKVNAVLDPVTGLDDAVALVRFCLEHDYQLRIIEQMPLDAGHHWQRQAMVSADQVLAELSATRSR